MVKRNASRITSIRSSKSATLPLAGWGLTYPKELPVDLPVPLECHALTMNAVVLQLTDADIGMLQCSTQFRILIINAHFVADNAFHALASSVTAKPTFNVKEEVVVIRNGWTPMKKKGRIDIYTTHNIDALLNSFYSQRLHKVDRFLQGLSTTCFYLSEITLEVTACKSESSFLLVKRCLCQICLMSRFFSAYVILGFHKCFFVKEIFVVNPRSSLAA